MKQQNGFSLGQMNNCEHYRNIKKHNIKNTTIINVKVERNIRSFSEYQKILTESSGTFLQLKMTCANTLKLRKRFTNFTAEPMIDSGVFGWMSVVVRTNHV